jgi:16S rRNA (cytosine967-C5)-methyltransferase
MKLHRNLAVAVINALKEILLEKKQADQTVGALLQSNKSWGSRDRNFIASNIYGTVRYLRLYEYCIDEELFGEVSLWKIFGARLILEHIELPDWVEFTTLQHDAIKAKQSEAIAKRAIRESVPDWLDELGQSELGEQWEKEITALNQTAKFSIRINTLKTSKGSIKVLFGNEQVEFTETDLAPDALILNARKNFRNHEAYRHGLFEVQDISSQLVAPFLDAAPGMNVIDGCCGAGGKTLHLAALMQNRGEILAVDTHEKKLEELEKRAARTGVRICKTLPAQKLSRHYQALLHSFADRILLDVPCSGLGVLRRKPDAKWSLTPKFISELIGIQKKILDEYAPMLKHGGLMVYSTCSILPSENEKQIESFLQRNNEYELVEEKKISAAESGYDGFYIAKLKRK